LTELLVVIGITIIVMSMGAMAFRDSLRNRQIKNAASTLQAAILNVRAMAVTMRRSYYGYLDKTNAGFGVYGTSGGDHATDPPEVKVIWFHETISVQTPAASMEIHFRPDGTIYWSGSDTTQDIILEEAGGKQAVFDLIANTGWPRYNIP
jgi:Tfp pilus assembly protein FimT